MPVRDQVRDSVEKAIYAVVGAGDLIAERVGELADDDKRTKRINSLTRRGKKVVKSVEKQIDETRAQLNESFSRPAQLDELLAEAQKRAEEVRERLPFEVPQVRRSQRGSKVSSNGTAKGRKPAAKSSAKTKAKKPAAAKSTQETAAV